MIKQTLLTLILFLAALRLLAQVPQGINYQAVIRDNTGSVLGTQPIGMRLSVLNVGGTAYQETHSASTNDLGLVNLVIGNGTPVVGTFSAINWANGPYTVQVEADIAGGTNYQIIGSQQLMSVPYAHYSNEAKRLTGGSSAKTLIYLGGM
jgi:hypothetical protein